MAELDFEAEQSFVAQALFAVGTLNSLALGTQKIFLTFSKSFVPFLTKKDID